MDSDILVGVSLNDEASWKGALPVAVERCRKFGAQLNVLTLVPDFAAVKTVVAQVTPYTEILRVAADLGRNLMVLRSHPPELKDYRLGPNAARVVRHAHCSVLVVRNRGGARRRCLI